MSNPPRELVHGKLAPLCHSIVYCVILFIFKLSAQCQSDNLLIYYIPIHHREQMMEMYNARQRRAFLRGTKRKHNALLKRLRKVSYLKGLLWPLTEKCILHLRLDLSQYWCVVSPIVMHTFPIFHFFLHS